MEAAADLELLGSGSGADLELIPPVFEEHYSRFPSDELCSELQALGQELEEARAGKSHFRADSQLALPLRQKIFKFLQGRVNPADQGLQGLILHELPKAEPDWDLTLSGFLPFLLRPPQPNAAQAAAAAATQAAAAASRQRVGSKVDASTGQQARDFTSYTANKPLPISDADNEPGHVHFVTAPCKGAAKQQIGKYRGFVCVMKQTERPADGRDWRRLQLKGDGEEPVQGWVDVSVALGVLEPKTEAQQPGRKRARRGSAAAAAGGGASGSALADPAAAAAGNSGSGPALAEAMATTVAAAAAAAAAGVAAASTPTLAGLQMGIPAQAAALPAHHMLDPLLAHMTAAAAAAAAAAGGTPVSMQQAFMPGWQQPAFAASGGGFGSIPSLSWGGTAPVPAAPGTFPGLLLGAPAPTSAAAAAALPATLAAVVAPASNADDLANRLAKLQISMQHKQLSAKLLTACRDGHDLVQCLVQGPGGTQQQQQQQQQAKTMLLQLLQEGPIVDKDERGLLHLVATHSFGVPHDQRLRQLELLLEVDGQMGHSLSQAGNNNGATALVVAAGSGIKGRDDAEVFSRLLEIADADVLATPTKSGWTLLHCLAHAAEGDEAPAVAQLLQSLMEETVLRVRRVAQEVQAADPEAAGVFEELCLRSEEPQGPRFAGRRFMQQLQV